jgi:ADP-ribose pyrophosphatase YjhB (NUDIX family)
MRSYILVPRAVVLSGRHVLLVRDTPGHRAPSPARWHLPGGEVLAGETPQRAVERLIKLRTGLTVAVEGCLDALARRGGDPGSGKPTQLLHVFFLCRPTPDNDPGLLPGDAATPQLLRSPATGGQATELAGPPGGADWGWTDLSSGLAALRHDVVGEWVVTHLTSLLNGALPAGQAAETQQPRA